MTYDYYWLVQQGRYAECVAEARRTLARDPLSAAQHWRLGLCYMLVRQFDLALRALEKAVELNPNYVPALLHMPFVLGAQGRIPEALAMIGRAGPYARVPMGMAYHGLVYGSAGR